MNITADKVDLLVLTILYQLLLIMQTLFNFYEISFLNDEKNRSEPSHLVSVPCYRSLGSHLRSIHLMKGEVTFIPNNVNKFKKELSFKYSKWSPFCLQYEGIVFIAMMVRDVSGLLHFWTFGAGAEDEISRYISEIQISSESGIRCQYTFEGPAVSIDRPLEEVLAGHEGLVLVSLL
jgi:hypothetical protein